MDTASTSLRILVVEDDPAIRELVAPMIESIGDYEVSQSPDGEHAWALLQQEGFDVVLTDNHMPRIEGLELIRLMRGDPKLSSVGIILMTGYASDQVREEARHLGVKEILLKPFGKSEFSAAIKRVLEPAHE